MPEKSNPRQKNVTIKACMEFRGEHGDGVMGLWYGIKIELENACNFPLMIENEITVSFHGDGGFASEYAAKRRLNIYKITRDMAAALLEQLKKSVREEPEMFGCFEDFEFKLEEEYHAGMFSYRANHGKGDLVCLYGDRPKK